MRDVYLCAMVLENFRSFRERTRIEFSDGPGLKFLTGDNQVEPRLGANGAGKSTVWDAVAYCLYGTSVKGIRASDLTSWGADAPYVELHWKIEGEPLIIARRGSPNKLTFLAEGDEPQPIEQINVDRAIGLSRARFLQSVIFGQSVPLFIDLPGPERGILLDEILDLGLWLKASAHAAKQHTELSRAVDQINQTIAFETGRLEGMESLEAIQSAIDAWAGTHDAQIEQMIESVEQEEAKLAAMKPRIRSTSAAVDALPSSAELNREIQAYQQAKSDKEAHYRDFFKQLHGVQKQLDFYQHTELCSECGQNVPASYARERIARITDLKRDLELRLKGNGAQTMVIIQNLQRLVGEQEKLERKREFLIEQRTSAAAEYRAQERAVESAAQIVERMMEEENPHVDRYELIKGARALAEAKIKAGVGQRRQSQSKMMRAEFWKEAFKRVRLFMVKRVLAQLEAETAASAAALGLIGWTISFSTEMETKSGTTRQGIHVQVSSPTASAPWEAWSGGEGQRIRLAVALGLSSLIQRQAGVNIMFEVWDEPSAWLSPEGIEDLLECLKHRVEVTRKSLWLCDHRALIYSGFSEIWQVQKRADGSHMSLLSDMES